MSAMSHQLTFSPKLLEVKSKPDLEVGQLSKDLSADVAVVSDLSILSAEGVSQRLASIYLPTSFGPPEVDNVPDVALSGGGGFGRAAVGNSGHSERWRASSVHQRQQGAAQRSHRGWRPGCGGGREVSVDIHERWRFEMFAVV